MKESSVVELKAVGGASYSQGVSNLLPPQIKKEIPEQEEEYGHQKQFNYLTLIWPLLSLVGGSLIGPVNNFLPCKDLVWLTLVWRQLTMSIIITVGLVVLKIYKTLRGEKLEFFKFTNIDSDGDTGPKQAMLMKAFVILMIFVAQIMSLGWNLGLTWATLNIV